MNIKRDASISECGTYRWWLTREWEGGSGQRACFVMLNPSTADANVDDPTIRRCIAFAMSWGMSGLIVRNLFPYRATDPKKLAGLTFGELVGNADERSIAGKGMQELLDCQGERLVVAGWGAGKIPHRQDHLFVDLVRRPIYCLKQTANAQPGHPLYVKGVRRGSQPLYPYRHVRPIDVGPALDGKPVLQSEVRT